MVGTNTKDHNKLLCRKGVREGGREGSPDWTGRLVTMMISLSLSVVSVWLDTD